MNLRPFEKADLLAHCEECFEGARQNIVKGAELLYAIKQTAAYEERGVTFSEFVEQDLKISKSFAAKLCAVWEHYIIEGKLKPKVLEGADSEALYLASKLNGDAEKQVELALSLNRDELRLQSSFERNGTEHEHTPITICSSCHKRL